MPVMQSPPGPRVLIDGREMLYFAGTGYLGLQGDPRVIEAACEAVRCYGVGPATSRTGFGESPPLQEVERQAALFFGVEQALYVASGYAGMSVLMQDQAGSDDLILADEWLHMAGLDACAAGLAHVERFRHGDADDLYARLRAWGGRGEVFVLCDGVSPVRGDIAPADAYLRVLHEHGRGRLVVDDAHGVGVLGRCGHGTIEHAGDAVGARVAVNAGIDTAVQAWTCGTLSKALGGSGGILAGSAAFIDRLRRDARWFHGAAAPSAPTAGAAQQALAIAYQNPALRDRLRANARRLRAGLRGLGIEVEDWSTPIICIRIGDGCEMARIQQTLFSRGIAIAHSRNYAGVDAEGALRIAVFANHTDEMIDELVAALGAVV